MFLYRWYFMLLLMSVCFASNATHIVGGEISYKHIINDSFEIRLDLYIDCINGSPGAIQIDNIAVLGIFDTSGSLIRSIVSPRGLPQRINSVNYNCVVPPTNACVDKYSYLYYISLPQIQGGYIISFQRCCRNNSISNIVNPGNTGATYWTSIPDTVQTAGYNSSAQFTSLPPNFICNARDFVFDHSATDPDGDSVSYKLYTPYIGADPFNNVPRPPAGPPYSGINWLSPYSEQQMMNGNPELFIDSITGKLTVKPVNTGQFVVGIAAYEYRNGNLININRRDFQFNVLNCVFNTVSSIGKDITVCSDTVRFINTSVGADTYLWSFGDSSTTKDTSTLKEPVYVYPGPGTYTVKLVVYNGNCSDSSFSKIDITKDTFRFAGRDTSICLGASVKIGTIDKGIFNYTWSPSLFLNDSSLERPTSTPLHNITYIGVRKNTLCTNIDTMEIRIREPKAGFAVSSLANCIDGRLVFDSITEFPFMQWSLNNDSVSFEALGLALLQFDKSYTIGLVISDGQCFDSLQKEVMLDDTDTIEFIPNVFTPNNDGINDCYGINHIELRGECNRLFIYNRWGLLIYDSNKNGSCWNGYWKGEQAPEGVYFYLLQHKQKTHHGTISLIR